MRHLTGNGTDHVETVHTTSLVHIERNLDRLVLSSTHGQRFQQQSGQITLQSALLDKLKFFKATRHAEIKKIVIPRSMAAEALSW